MVATGAAAGAAGFFAPNEKKASVETAERHRTTATTKDLMLNRRYQTDEMTYLTQERVM